MTASGPFAMGPALAGQAGRRTVPRPNFTPILPQGPGATQKLGAGLTHTTAPMLGVKSEPEEGDEKGKQREKTEDEEEVYSEADEGVEIVDMDKVRTMDWMAPEVLQKEKKPVKVKKETKEKVDVKGKGACICL